MTRILRVAPESPTMVAERTNWKSGIVVSWTETLDLSGRELEEARTVWTWFRSSRGDEFVQSNDDDHGSVLIAKGNDCEKSLTKRSRSRVCQLSDVPLQQMQIISTTTTGLPLSKENLI